jgi:prolyl-tRNA synthetase
MSLEAAIAALSISAVAADNAAPTKALVFKPKTAKTAAPVPIVVFALQATNTPGNIIAATAAVKEPRLAKEDLIQEFFNVSAKEFSVANVSKDHAFKIKLLIDKEIVESGAYKLSTESSTVSVSGSDILGHLQGTGVEIITVDFSAAPAPSAAVAKKEPKKVVKKDTSAQLDSKLIGITVDKYLDFPGWYQQILTKGDMMDYYDVSGCYILRPASYSIWEEIQSYFNTAIKRLGVKNAYFPMFVSSKVLEKEKDHIEGFAPEVAWVTRAGQSELEEPIAIRPTSETVMYPYYAKWIQSHRDLPLKLNQWNSVVRWEFKHPQPFLRTREFLWQEGHTAHLTEQDATKEVLQILDHYESIYHDLLAVPVVKGKKTEKEKFAGGDYTTTVEGYIPTTGRGIQGATSHHLGQNFSKMFNISVENPEGSDKPKLFAWQNSWGLSTRVIGVCVMVHSDNKGLVIPPRVSQYQAVVIPVGITAKTSKEQENAIFDGAKGIENKLLDAGIRAIGDYRTNYSPGWKFSDQELKGIPIRLEFGPKDLENNSVTVVRRNDSKKYNVSLDSLAEEIPKILDQLHNDLFAAAKESFDSHKIIVEDWKDFVPTLNGKNVILSPWCGRTECEEDIKDSSTKTDTDEDEEVDDKAPSMGAKSLCIPFDQPELKEGTKCVKCQQTAVNYTLFGRSY